MLKRELMRQNPKRQLGAFAREKMPFMPSGGAWTRRFNGGAPLLGFNAWCSRRTGSARERAIASALRVTAEAVQHHVNEIIAREWAQANEKLAAQKFPFLFPA